MDMGQKWGLCRSPLERKGGSVPFLAYVYCDQTAGWIRIRIPLGTGVGIDLGDIMLDGGQKLPPKVARLNFRPMSIVARRSPISATAELFYNYRPKW